MTAHHLAKPGSADGYSWNDSTAVYEQATSAARFGDDTWSLEPLPRYSSSARNLHFDTLAESWKPVIKAVIWICLNPRSEVAVACRVKRLPQTRGGVVGLLSRLRWLSDYFSSGSYPSSGKPPSHLDQSDFLRILNDAQSGENAFAGRSLKTSRLILKELERLHLLGPHLPGGGVREVPFSGHGVDALMRAIATPTNLTSIIPWPQYDAFCEGAWILVDCASREILPSIELDGQSGRVQVMQSWSAAISGQERLIEDLRPGRLRAQGTYMVRLLQTAALVTIARSTLMRRGELLAIPSRQAVVLKGDRPYVRSRQFKGVRDPHGVPRLWVATDRVVRAVEVAEALAGDSPTLMPLEMQPTIQGTWFKRLFGFLAVAPQKRIGGGREIGHSRQALEAALVSYDDRRGHAEIDLTRCGKLDKQLGFRTLRQTSADYLGRRSGAELAVRNQLGHSDLRTTKVYINGGGGVVKTAWSDYQRRKLTADLGPELLNEPLGGIAGRQIEKQRRLLRSDDAREQYLDHVIDRLHTGHACHCVFDSSKAVCNPGGEGPLLRVGVCATLDCSNALLTADHRAFWELEVEKLSAALGRKLSPQRREYYLAQLTAARAAVSDLEETDV